MVSREQLLAELQSAPFATKNRNYWQAAIKALSNPNTKIYCGKSVGTGKTATSITWLWDTRRLLEHYGFHQFETGNDAPKGGRHGDYILVWPH